MTRPDRTALLSAVVLALLMLVTRFQHFGSPVHLPDASLAVFFLAGMLLSWRWFPALALLAAVIDAAAIGWGHISDYCVTPAYVFLLPTYAAMTIGGAWVRRARTQGVARVTQFGGAILLSSLVAFAVSNGSFYFFSGYFTRLSLAEYVARSGGYAVPYVGWALFYGLAGFAVIGMVRHFRRTGTARA